MSKDKTIQLREKINQLNQQAWDIRVNDSLNAFTLCRKATEMARAIKYKRGIAEGTRTMGFCYVRLSRNDEALPVLKESLSLFEELNDLEGQAVVCEYLAVIKRNRGELGAALELLFNAVALSQQKGATENEAIHHYQIGVTYKYLGNFDKALDALFKSISIHKENKNRVYQSYPINVIGSIYFETGDHKKALEYFKEGLKLRQEFKDKLGESGSLDNIGYTFFKLKKYTQALKHCQQALAICTKTGDKRSQASTLQHLAEIYAHAGDTKQAILSSTTSRKIRKVTGDKRGEAEVLLFLAGLPEQDPTKVVEWIKEALRIAKDTRSPDIRSRAHYRLYEYYKQAGKFKEANGQLEQHFKLEKELHKNSVNQKVANLEIARKAEETRKNAETVMQKNEELKRLNKELEIETSLERVRAVAMGMKAATDMLEVCKTIALQLAALGVKEIRNVQTAIFSVDKGTYMNYEYYAKHEKTFITEAVYTNHKIGKAFAAKMMKGKGEVSITHITGERKVKEWLAYQKTTNVFIDTWLEKASSLNYYWHSLGPVALGISTYEPLSKADLTLFQRFLKVFELAYRRYLDIEKAELQTREAQIEVAVERVRAKALAMHTSTEILGVVVTMQKELKKLNISGVTAATIYLAEDEGRIRTWDFTTLNEKEEDFQWRMDFVFRLEETDPGLWIRRIWNSKEKYTVIRQDEKDLARMLKFLRDFDKEAAGNVEKLIIKHKIKQGWHPTVQLAHGKMNVDFIEAPPDEMEFILPKMGAAFDLAYKRFRDLQKAETQAREAQLELALERVRARTMAMQKGDELAEVVGLLYNQFHELDFGLYQILVSIIDSENKMIEWWSRGFNEAGLPQCYHIPIIDHPFCNLQTQKWKSGTPYYAHTLEGEVKKSWEEYLFTKTDLKNLPKPVQKKMRSLDKVYLSDAFMKHGVLQAAGPATLPGDKEAILKRFAKVLDLAYTRYLDIEQAQTQAREAQIEAALERIRAKAMAMHHSHELDEVLEVLFTQFDILGITPMSTHMTLINLETNTFTFRETGKGGRRSFGEQVVAIDSMDIWKYEAEKWRTSQPLTINRLHFPKESLPQVWQIFHESFASMPEDAKIVPEDYPDGIYHTAGNCKFGYIGMNQVRPPTEDEEQIVLKFATEFGRFYQRFLDLQKAESQSREAQIQLSLERVRAKAMAMQKSNELLDTAALLFEQLKQLGENIERIIIGIINEQEQILEGWATRPEGSQMISMVKFALDEPIVAQKIYTAWKQQKKSVVIDLQGEELERYFQFQKTKNSQLKRENFGNRRVENFAIFSKGAIGVISVDPDKPGDIELYERFAAAFDHTYTRFLDLQKAEASTKEAKIEIALERVRAKAMSMHKSEDFNDAIAVVFEELKKLDVGVLRCGISVLDKEKRTGNIWVTSIGEQGSAVQISGDESFDIHPLLSGAFEAWLKQQDFYYLLEGVDLDNYYKAVKATNIQLPEVQMIVSEAPVQRQYCFTAVYKAGGLFAFRETDFPEEAKKLIKRFAGVFDLTYKRFVDLQNAEALAREAQIETALERVRSRTMAMHKSEEVTGVAVSLNEELIKLGFDGGSTIIIIDKENGDTEQWTGFSEDKTVKSCDVPYFKHPYHDALLEAFKRGKSFLVYTLTGDEKRAFDDHCFATGYKDFPETDKQWMRGLGSVTFSLAFMKYGAIHWGHAKLTDEQLRIIQRFSKVFEQSYTRFLDLQKAEAQARESLIQLALERVRARTMAMQHSDELAEASVVLFQQFAALGQTPDRISIGIVDEQNGTTDVWATDQVGTQINIHFKAMNNARTIIQRILHDWKAGKKSSVVDLQGDDLKDWIMYLRNELGMSINDEYFHGRRLHQVSFFSQGWLNITTLEPLPAETLDLLDRFAAVFNLTYTRFVDLKKAEAQAREAKIEAALERVRTKVIGMSHSHELQEISYVFGDQMRQLGVDWQFSYFWLIEEDKDVNTFWITWPDNHTSVTGYSLAKADQYTKECLVVWKRGDKIHANRVEQPQVQHWLDTFEQITVDAGLAAHAVMQANNFKDGVYYYDAMMKYGSFGICNNRPATEEERKIQYRFAIEFERAYTRFLDLKQAEQMARQAEEDLVQLKIEKHRTEDALNELQATQKQLIQSEKMASLGELTAGIAHEIQNPLNFVNNFSEVSKELLEEMVEEVKRGNYEEVEILVNDVKQNLEKINHHGKRADGIVKGMLQHSRSSSGQKELTDINKLADEYLRLAYHGLRAKDKSFNATMKANFDENVGMINIIPQDMGRVILNLITNAFYVVAEKKKQAETGYEPTVSVVTKKVGDKVEISVHDNGNGIPPKVLDKIFQPFFTTKPTGEGTGLGLSLSYDIVKAHGGKLEVKTKEGEGSEFVIQLPGTSKLTT